ncbi:MAG: SUF system Fe-S cluster assembly regulator [Alphaproteobacteria bacterium]
MKLSRLTDYAVILLTKLSFGDGEPASAARLSEELMLPQPTVSKLLKMLTKAELVSSQRGATGGYALTRSAEAISIGDVIAAIEGPVALTACIDDSEEDVCGVQSFCGMRGNWVLVNAAVNDALNKVKLSEMAPAWMNMFGPVEPVSEKA